MEYESYLYPSHRHQYDLLMGRKLEKKDRLRVVPVTDAYVLPAKPAAGFLFGAGGILDQAMRFVPESAILTRAGVTSYPEPECMITGVIFWWISAQDSGMFCRRRRRRNTSVRSTCTVTDSFIPIFSDSWNCSD